MLSSPLGYIGFLNGDILEKSTRGECGTFGYRVTLRPCQIVHLIVLIIRVWIFVWYPSTRISRSMENNPLLIKIN